MSPQAQRYLIGGAIAVSGIIVLMSVLSKSSQYVYGGPNKGDLNRDPTKLLPSFAARLNELFIRMRQRGWDPMLHEGYRTPERAAELAKQGVGIVDSMHSYGAAADIKSVSQNWGNPAFFKALGEVSAEVGLYWGGSFGDTDHVQAVPATAAQQNAIRNAKTVAQRDAIVARNLGPVA